MVNLPVAAAGVAAVLTASMFSFGSTAGSLKAHDEALRPTLAQATTAPAPEGYATIEMCGDRSSMVADLQQQFREVPLASGLVDRNSVLEIFVSKTGTWTILATDTDGKSCVMAVGEGFETNINVVTTGA